MKLILLSALAAVLSAAGAQASPTAAPDSSPSPKAAATVHIANFAYRPPTVKIVAGQTVKFVNDDSDAHTVTADDKSFDSAGLDTNDSWSHTFAKPGTFHYFCALHPYMKATIIVTAKPESRSS